jgi:hypothetical protein
MTQLYRGMDQAALRAAYDNVAAVADVAGRILEDLTRADGVQMETLVRGMGRK